MKYLYRIVLWCGLLSSATAYAQPAPLDLVGIYKMLPNARQTVDNTFVYGLSAIDCTPSGACIAVSDDRSRDAPSRFYQFKLEPAADFVATINRAVPHFAHAVAFTTPEGDVMPAGAVDPEGLRRLPNGHVLMSSEGWVNKGTPASLTEYTAFGQYVRAWPLPNFTDLRPQHGFFENRAIEALTLTPSQKYVWWGAERPLQQDNSPTHTRIVQYNAATTQPVAAYVYPLDAVPHSFKGNGLSDMLALNDNSFLMIERADHGEEQGYNIRLYKAVLSAANTNVLTCDALPDCAPVVPLQKTLVAQWDGTYPDGSVVDNIEGVTFGPRLENGQRSLIFISDDNKNEQQETQIAVFALPNEGL